MTVDAGDGIGGDIDKKKVPFRTVRKGTLLYLLNTSHWQAAKRTRKLPV